MFMWQTPRVVTAPCYVDAHPGNGDACHSEQVWCQFKGVMNWKTWSFGTQLQITFHPSDVVLQAAVGKSETKSFLERTGYSLAGGRKADVKA